MPLLGGTSVAMKNARYANGWDPHPALSRCGGRGYFQSNDVRLSQRISHRRSDVVLNQQQRVATDQGLARSVRVGEVRGLVERDGVAAGGAREIFRQPVFV